MTEPAVVADEATPDTAPQPEEAPPAPATDRPEVEVVTPQPPAQPPAVPEGPSALERASEELLATPGAPGRDEFLVLATTARVLSMSAGAPAAVRNNPWLAFHLALIGRDLGISPSAAIAQVDVIGYDERNPNDYSRAQLSLSPELLNGQIKRMGLGSIVKAASSPTSCVAVAMLPGGRVDVRCARSWPDHVEDERRPCACTFDLILGEVEFTWADAQQAGLADAACSGPDAHTAACVQGGSGTRGKRCHQGYRSYPQRMMWWRAAGWCQSDYFPEAGIGLYSPEELGAIVDPNTGRPVDPATVALPEGYEEPEKPHNPADDLLAEADDESELGRERRDLRARIDALLAAGEPVAQALRELWEQEDSEGARKTPPFPHLRRRHLTRARAVVKQVEDRVKGGHHGEEAKQAWGDAAVTAAGFGQGKAQDAQEAADGEDAQEEAQPADGAEGGQEAGESADPGLAAYDEALEQYQRDLEDSAEARRARAEQVAADAGLPMPAAEPQAMTDDELAEAIVAEVSALSPVEVLAALTEHEVEPQGRIANHRKQLAEALFDKRRPATPTPEA